MCISICLYDHVSILFIYFVCVYPVHKQIYCDLSSCKYFFTYTKIMNRCDNLVCISSAIPHFWVFHFIAVHLFSISVSIPLVCWQDWSLHRRFAHRSYTWLSEPILVGFSKPFVFANSQLCFYIFLVGKKKNWAVKVVWWQSGWFVVCFSQFCRLVLLVIIVCFTWCL